MDVKNIESDLFFSTDHSSLARLNHDNIIQLYDVGKYEKNGSHLPYIVVEYVQGYHLDEFCESKILTIRELLKLFQDLCEVIEFIHSKNIFHLDLKPANILVTADRPHRIKLIDFGSSKLSRSESKHFTRWDLINPLTLKFAAPEQYSSNEVVTEQADIYSLGAILYFLVTGKIPLGEGARDKVKITREVTDRNLLPVIPSKRVLELKDETKFGVPLKTLNQILSGDLDSIIMKALSKRRRDRYQSVSEFRRDIDNFLKGKPVRARRDTGYKTMKLFSQILGFKGGLADWEKWKSPTRRLSVFVFLLVLLGAAGIIYTQYKAASTFLIGRIIDRPLDETSINAFYQIGGTAIKRLPGGDGIINVYCGTEWQAELCFTFMKIPKGNFTTGMQGNEMGTPDFEGVKSKSNHGQTQGELEKSRNFTSSTRYAGRTFHYF